MPEQQKYVSSYAYQLVINGAMNSTYIAKGPAVTTSESGGSRGTIIKGQNIAEETVGIPSEPGRSEAKGGRRTRRHRTAGVRKCG